MPFNFSRRIQAALWIAPIVTGFVVNDDKLWGRRDGGWRWLARVYG